MSKQFATITGWSKDKSLKANCSENYHCWKGWPT